MGNAGFHCKKRLRKPAWGKATLFLPPYSPGCNPVEKSRANMKQFLRDNVKDFPSVGKAIYDYFGVKALYISASSNQFSHFPVVSAAAPLCVYIVYCLVSYFLNYITFF
jgi:transposase